MATEGLGFEITELRLGLPGDGPVAMCKNNEKKRVFSDVEVEDESHGVRGRKQAFGWPPVCSYRQRNSLREKKYVKVRFEGAPFQRKVDFGVAKGYGELVNTMEKLFGSPIESSDCIVSYEDRDGDWMLVGDVPWKMFIESCKRLRIMKKAEATRSEMNSLSL